ncbi:MAG: hypothetical protein ABEN55_01015 [Bradymonadaceae bacterium]
MDSRGGLLVAALALVLGTVGCKGQGSNSSQDQQKKTTADDQNGGSGDLKLDDLEKFTSNLDGGPWYEVTWPQLMNNPGVLHGYPVILKGTYVSGFEKLYLEPKKGDFDKIWIDTRHGRGENIHAPPKRFWDGAVEIKYDVQIAGRFYTRYPDGGSGQTEHRFDHKIQPHWVRFPDKE